MRILSFIACGFVLAIATPGYGMVPDVGSLVAGALNDCPSQQLNLCTEVLDLTNCKDFLADLVSCVIGVSPGNLTSEDVTPVITEDLLNVSCPCVNMNYSINNIIEDVIEESSNESVTVEYITDAVNGNEEAVEIAAVVDLLPDNQSDGVGNEEDNQGGNEDPNVGEEVSEEDESQEDESQENVSEENVNEEDESQEDENEENESDENVSEEDVNEEKQNEENKSKEDESEDNESEGSRSEGSESDEDE